MSRLPLVDPKDAQGKVHDLFEAVKAKVGRVPNMMKGMANSPALLEGYLGLAGALAGGSVGPKLRERIALQSAEVNGCGYCLAAHSLTGKLAGLDEEERLANRRGHSSDPKAEAALVFARKLLGAHGHVTEEEIRQVKEAGYSDGELAEIIGLVALNVLTNLFNIATDTPVEFPAVKFLDPA